MKISVVIPVYGCKAAIRELHRRLTISLEAITEDYEVIFVNDACPQNSWDIIEGICEEDRRVTGIELSRNFGQMKAILAGLDYADGDYFVVMDCDLQDRPEEIPNLYNKIREGYDVVFARRADRKDSRIKISISSIFYKIYTWAADENYDGALCNFSMVKKNVIKEYCTIREQHRSYVMYIKWLGFRQAVIDVEHNARFEGVSSYTLKKRFEMAFEILTSQSDKVLHKMTQMGIIIAFISFTIIVGLFINYFVGDVSDGWTSIIATMCLFGGLTISAIGVVGIYVGNVFMQVKERPLYVIRQIKNNHNEKAEEYQNK